MRQATTLKGAVTRLHANAAKRARLSGVPFTITKAHVAALLAGGLCAVTGLPFDYSPAIAGAKRPYAASLDQIEPGAGYTPDNTRAVVSIFNYAKNAWTDQDVLRLAQALCKNAPAPGGGTTLPTQS